jgi:hypothetical protein
VLVQRLISLFRLCSIEELSLISKSMLLLCPIKITRAWITDKQAICICKGRGSKRASQTRTSLLSFIIDSFPVNNLSVIIFHFKSLPRQKHALREQSMIDGISKWLVRVLNVNKTIAIWFLIMVDHSSLAPVDRNTLISLFSTNLGNFDRAIKP